MKRLGAGFYWRPAAFLLARKWRQLSAVAAESLAVAGRGALNPSNMGGACAAPTMPSASFRPRAPLQRRHKALAANAGAICGLTALLLASPVWSTQIKDVRLWRAPDHTRLVFDVSVIPRHKLIVLDSPLRIVVDLADTSTAAGFDHLPLAGTPIQLIRHGIRAGDDLRVVLDLAVAVEPHSFVLKAEGEQSNRLVVDLYDLPREKEKELAPGVKKSVADSSKRDIVIAIDAGHGGEDPGASGPGRVREKDVVLAISRELKALFARETGFKPVMIRQGDYYLGLSKRRELARSQQADLLVSVHADAFRSPKAKGVSVYTLSERGAASTSTFAKFLAQRENASDRVGGVDLSSKDDQLAEVIYDMSRRYSRDWSNGIGGRVLNEMGSISRLHSKRVEQAAFVVLKSPDIPSILVETGFISNPQEARLLNSRGYQGKMARSIYRGVLSWFVEHAPADTLLSWQQQTKGREYTIARGDTLSEIALRFDVSVASIRNRNGLPGSTIKVGQKLIIPVE